MMLLESSVAIGAAAALRAIPAAELGQATQNYLGVKASWVGITSSILLNLVYWILWLGTGYLLFFWKKPAGIPPPHR